MSSVVKSGRLSATTHALIGAGHMGGALLNGWLSGTSLHGVEPKNILVIDPAPGEAAKRALGLGVKYAANLTKGSASGLKLCLLAIKPQIFPKVGPGLAEVLPKDCLIVSIMAGIPLAGLESIFVGHPIVRVMPNLPAAYGAGIAAYTVNDGVTEAHKLMAEQALKSGGEVVYVKTEREIDMVTALSGSGPGYVFYFTEIMASIGHDLGLDKELADKLARQTVIGSGVVLARAPQSASELRRSVTSPAGTTEAALDVLMAKDGLPALMKEAIRAAFKRSQELGK